jgi:flagellar biosynthesis chaperone FliJ
MAEGNEVKSVAELLAQIDKFEKTIAGLSQNVQKLKQKLQENREKYGDDTTKWPKE